MYFVSVDHCWLIIWHALKIKFIEVNIMFLLWGTLSKIKRKSKSYRIVKFDLMDENLNLSLERAIIKNKIIIDIIYITNFKRTRDYMEPDMMNLALNFLSSVKGRVEAGFWWGLCCLYLLLSVLSYFVSLRSSQILRFYMIYFFFWSCLKSLTRETWY
jgi:hypothetical protein